MVTATRPKVLLTKWWNGTKRTLETTEMEAPGTTADQTETTGTMAPRKEVLNHELYGC